MVKYNFSDESKVWEYIEYDSIENATSRNISFEDYYADTDGYSDYDDYTVFTYEAFDFERPIYVCLWEILVIVTTVFNIIVIIIFVRIGMRSVTNTILVALAIADSLTGLVTLPSYIYVYSHYEPGAVKDAYVLEKDWCNFFMISKFFLSKWFHTASIWLTLLLAFQRFVGIMLPLKAKIIITLKKTLIALVAIYFLSPVLHIYHLLHSKADEHGMCKWALDDGGLVYLWITVLLMHLIPCILLVVLTALMIIRLYRSASKISDGKWMTKSSIQRRGDWNRRLSIIVTTIVIVFLIPEIPYGIFQLYTVLREHVGKNIMDLQINRAFHAVYEILLLLSYHANFWIYTVLNKRFRSELKKALGELFAAIRKLFPQGKKSVPLSYNTQNVQEELIELKNENVVANKANRKHDINVNCDC